MKRILFVIVLTLLACASGQIRAETQANPDLAKQKNCMSCHAVDAKKVGPAYKDVAKKYAGQKGAEDLLVQKVMKGGSGNWGVVAMPPNTQVTEAEARTLVKWVLGLK
jgi:cytochrome c